MNHAAPILDGRTLTENEMGVVRGLRALKLGVKVDSRQPDRGHGTLRVDIVDGWETLIKCEYSHKTAPR